MVLGEENKTVKSYIERKQIPAAKAEMPEVTISQLLTEYDKGVVAGQALRSWEARCRVTEQGSTFTIHLGSRGRERFIERRTGNWEDEAVDYRRLYNGRQIQAIFPFREKLNISILTPEKYKDQTAGETPWPELPVGFPPFLETTKENCIPPQSLPDIRKVLADPAATILPQPVHVGGHACYVIEQPKPRRVLFFGVAKSLMLGKNCILTRKYLLGYSPRQNRMKRLSTKKRSVWLLIRNRASCRLGGIVHMRPFFRPVIRNALPPKKRSSVLIFRNSATRATLPGIFGMPTIC